MKRKESKHIKRKGILSDELYDRIFAHAHHKNSLHFNSRLIHLADCVDCGTVSPMEAYDAIEYLETSGYLPEWIDVRESNYSHTL